jgi:hypothetical protein
MVNYGFCFENNLYDSVKFKVNTDVYIHKQQKMQDIVASFN